MKKNMNKMYTWKYLVWIALILWLVSYRTGSHGSANYLSGALFLTMPFVALILSFYLVKNTAKNTTNITGLVLSILASIYVGSLLIFGLFIFD